MLKGNTGDLNENDDTEARQIFIRKVGSILKLISILSEDNWFSGGGKNV